MLIRALSEGRPTWKAACISSTFFMIVAAQLCRKITFYFTYFWALIGPIVTVTRGNLPMGKTPDLFELLNKCETAGGDSEVWNQADNGPPFIVHPVLTLAADAVPHQQTYSHHWGAAGAPNRYPGLERGGEKEESSLIKKPLRRRTKRRTGADFYLCTAPSRRNPPGRAVCQSRGHTWSSTWRNPPPSDLERQVRQGWLSILVLHIFLYIVFIIIHSTNLYLYDVYYKYYSYLCLFWAFNSV